ncbi:MAG TPA: FAD-dependent oxidoreductase [Streptosporangiaceae bacterium]|nr:FAD-dependent oxidoreductase [Streptosporangiaceae bacterium]
MAEPAQAKPAVAVIGGGYAGVNVAKSLDDVADVVLVEPKEAFVHNVASLRALVAPSWLPRIYLPYAGLLSHGRVIRDRAAKVDAGRVELASGDALQAGYIVLATGSAYPFPAKSDVENTAAAHERVLAAHAALAAAGRVLLLGAGPVGIELAGEIAAIWPDKHITLVDPARDVLGARFRAELKAEIRRQLAGLGVHVMLGTQLAADPPGEPGELGTFTVRTRPGGGELTADIWFRCYGVAPVSDYLAGGLAAARQPDGFVLVTPQLRVAGQDRVFALGDVAAADHKMAGAASRQAAVVAGNIRALITGQGELARYDPPPPGIIVPIGPDGGAGQRGGQGGLLPAEVVAQLKGRDMMVDRYIELLGGPVRGGPVSADGGSG